MAPVAGITEEAWGKVRDDVERGSCFYCHKVGHPSRDCLVRQKSIACFHCGNAGHLKSNCPELTQVNAVSGGDVPKTHPYLKVGVINGREYGDLIDTGNSCTLLKSIVAVKSGLGVRPSGKRLYGVGSTAVPSLEAVVESTIEIVIGGGQREAGKCPCGA